MSSAVSDRAAVLGLGIIGSRAYAKLAEAGLDVVCWNRTPKEVPGACATAAEAVEHAGIISLYLKDAPALREVMESIGDHLHEGSVVLNHSTVDLAATKWLEQICISRGCHFLDAPFTGSKLAAGEGQLVYYVGGDGNLAARMDAFLSITSKTRLYCGPAGSATVVKLATNLISACTVQAMAESLAITTSHGVPAETLMRAVSENVSASKLTAMKFPTMVKGDFDTHFSLANMGKDTRYMLALAEAAGVEIPAVAAVSKRMEELCAGGLGDLDYSALAKPYLDAR